jgi:hypothetical protein
MSVSKVVPEDAQEWLETLQQVGEGWWRQVGLAVKMGAHKALGLERREFTALIGQRLIDPREAIVELHREGRPMVEIADVLRVSAANTVARILREEGLIEAPAPPKQITTEGRAIDSTAEDLDELTIKLAADIEGLEAQLRDTDEAHKAGIENEVKKLVAQQRKMDDDRKTALEEEVAQRDKRLKELTEGLHKAIAEREQAVKGVKATATRDKKELQDKITEAQKKNGELKRELAAAQKADLDKEAQRRADKEMEARMAEIEAGFAPMYVQTAAEKVAQALEALKEGIEAGLTTKAGKQVARLNKNTAALLAECEVATAMTETGGA